MPESDLETLLDRLLTSVRDDRARAELEELKTRKFTLSDLMDAMESASDEELERWERDFFSTTELDDFPPGDPSAGNGPPDPTVTVPPPANGDPPGNPAGDPPPPASAETRPGRKRGNVYDWTTDEDGNVQQLGIGRVYTGEDEPEEVELPSDVDDDDDTNE